MKPQFLNSLFHSYFYFVGANQERTFLLWIQGFYNVRSLFGSLFSLTNLCIQRYGSRTLPLADGSSGPSSIVRETLTPLPRWTYDRKRQMILKMTEIVRIWQNIGIALNESNPLPPLTLLTSPIFFTHRKLKPKQRSYILCQQSNNDNSLTLLPDGTDYLRDHCVPVRVVDCARVNALSSSQ